MTGYKSWMFFCLSLVVPSIPTSGWNWASLFVFIILNSLPYPPQQHTSQTLFLSPRKVDDDYIFFPIEIRKQRKASAGPPSSLCSTILVKLPKLCITAQDMSAFTPYSISKTWPTFSCVLVVVGAQRKATLVACDRGKWRKHTHTHKMSQHIAP